VENAIHRYLTNELTDEEFKESIQAILDEFKGKNLLHQNIGQLTWEWEKRTPSERAGLRGSGFCSRKSVHKS